MPETRHVEIGELTLGNDRPLVLIAGPCVLESQALAEIAAGLVVERTFAWRCRNRGRAMIELLTRRLATVGQRSQKVSVAAPSLMSACIGAAPVITVPSMRSSSS